MTIKKQCSTPEECDKRYMLKNISWKTSVMIIIGGLAIVFAAGQWKKDIEYKVNKVITIDDKLDTIISRLNK